jgi:uncharacterized protein YdaT
MSRENTNANKNPNKDAKQSGKHVTLKVADSVVTTDVSRVHIISHERGWSVQREGAKRATSVCGTKSDAIKQGREIARKSNGELIIHTKEGRIEDSKKVQTVEHHKKG